MSFAEVRIDDNLIIYHTAGGPSSSTDIVVVDSGEEYRNAVWSMPLGRWDLGERSMMPPDFAVMKQFFHARQGKAQGFRFKDWADFKDEGGGVLGAIAGSTTTLQMLKNYTSGGTTIARKISKPIAGIQVFRNGVLDAGATVDLTSGIVTPTLTTGTLTWTGQFDLPVRFDADQLRAEFIGASGRGGASGVVDAYFHLYSLPIMEIRT
jgi:uncharacterized protein (TIGR02217 family)